MANKPVLVKCLVWDLDNTRWDGTLLEDSDVQLFDGIREVIIELDSRGDLRSERAEVTFGAPEVRCYAAGQARSLTASSEFSPAVVTVDSRRRRMNATGVHYSTRRSVAWLIDSAASADHDGAHRASPVR